MIGETIKEYTITRKLDEGGMAVVYEAQNEIGKSFAIKILKDEIAQNSYIRSCFRQEVDIMLKLDDVPGIRKIYDRTETKDGKLAIIMEYLDGMDLNKYVKKNGPFNVDTVKKICNQVLTALGEIHKRGIVHRDIKPSNLFYTKNGYIKILDFGISKLLFGDDDDATLRQTTTTKIAGTIAYLSPEQIRFEKNIDQRTDIYSFGLTLFYLLTGKDPSYFEDESLIEIADKQIIDILKKATRKDRDKRTQNCTDFLSMVSEEVKITDKECIDNQYDINNCRSKIVAIFADKLGVEKLEVVPSASITNDLGADSLDTVELIMELEKEFGITIPDDDAENIKTVGDAINYIESMR